MTSAILHGHIVGWAPDQDPEWESFDGEDWKPVEDGRLTVLARVLGDGGAREGWYFQREQDGSVTIEATNVYDGEPLEFVTLDAEIWAWVVASVSLTGEHGLTFAAAPHLHDGTTEGSEHE